MTMPMCKVQGCPKRQYVTMAGFCRDHWLRITDDTRALLQAAQGDQDHAAYQRVETQAMREIEERGAA